MNAKKYLFFILLIIPAILMAQQNRYCGGRIPVIYSTDIFQPPQDPDDHYDLAILSRLPELEVKALIFDLSTSWKKPEEIAIGALRQIACITGEEIPPHATGLRYPLCSEVDKAENQPEEFQKGVNLILNTLRESDEKVLLFLVGSCRDFAAAWNRDTVLLKQKIAAVYVNAGNGPDGEQFEWNVMLDPKAYLALMKSGLPIYWCPCFSKINLKAASPDEVKSQNSNSFNTYYVVPNQSDLLNNAPPRLKNFFSYALEKSQDDPLLYLARPPVKLPDKPRNMWSTAAFLHAAGRKIYFYNSQYIACSPEKACKLGILSNETDVYRFEKVRLREIERKDTVKNEKPLPPVFKGVLGDVESPVQVFHYVHPEYNSIMISILSDLLGNAQE
jgi:hypothetical protein